MEIWKDIEGHTNYMISNLGRIKSKERYDKKGHFRKEKILCLETTYDGYKRILLDGKHYSIHRLVANAFIPNNNYYPCINHKDENHSNNCVDNLEWCSYKYNNNYGTRRNKTYKKIIQYDKKGNIIKKYDSIISATIEVNGSKGNISKCCKKKIKSYKGYVWRYDGDKM